MSADSRDLGGKSCVNDQQKANGRTSSEPKLKSHKKGLLVHSRPRDFRGERLVEVTLH